VFDEAGEDEILLAAMMQLGATGGALGGALGGAIAGSPGLSGAAGARGGARGAARGFKRTKKDVAEQTVKLSMDLPEASRMVFRAVEAVGQVVGSEMRDDGSAAIRAVLGVGIGGLNPAVVTVIISQGEPAMSIARLRAAGREGLIKQHPASKALAKITPLLPAC
jgi:hypothetical protein